MAARLDAIDNAIDNGLNARPHIFDPPRAERPHHEAAQTAVVGRIELQPSSGSCCDRPVPREFVARIAGSFGR